MKAIAFIYSLTGCINVKSCSKSCQIVVHEIQLNDLTDIFMLRKIQFLLEFFFCSTKMSNNPSTYSFHLSHI